jgi:uncharacterized protein GlcG (DUF336 family)
MKWLIISSLSMVLVLGPVRADEHALFSIQVLTPETALQAASAALEKCRAEGYQVAVVVVDRMGIPQVVLRDRYAGAHTLEITAPGQPQAGVRQVTDALMLGGGMVIDAGGSLVGAIGVSGAPGGELDDLCAAAGIAAIEDDIAF